MDVSGRPNQTWEAREHTPGVAMRRLSRLFNFTTAICKTQLYSYHSWNHRQFMSGVIFSHEKCSTSPHQWAVTTSASSEAEEGRRQITRTCFESYRQTTGKTALWHWCAHFSLSCHQLSRTLGGQQWRNYLREMQLVPEHFLRWHWSLLNRTIFSLCYW